MIHFPIDKLTTWYNIHKRDLPWRQTKDMYAVWLSEVMLQQTQVVTVIPYYEKFLAKFPTIADLANGSEQDVLKLWEGLGYYSRVRNFHHAAQKVVSTYNGIIPTNLSDFESLPGVGPYISAAVLSITCGHRLPTVDGNVLRVYTRFFTIEEDIRKNKLRDRIFKELQEIIPIENPGDFNQSMMELGALICTPKNPDCVSCPLSEDCNAYKTKTIEKYPFKSPSLQVPQYNVSVAVIIKENKFYIQKRPSEGHLGGLWEFPGGKAENKETPEQTLLRECLEELGTEIEIISLLKNIKHAYSHFKINMSVFLCRLKERSQIHPPEGVSHRWISIEEINEYPFPGANHKFFPELEKAMELFQ